MSDRSLSVASPIRTTATHCPYCALQCGMHIAGDREAPEVLGNAKFPVNKGGSASRDGRRARRSLIPIA
jgi:assimilatory nitrate reductase catalytic subunit